MSNDDREAERVTKTVLVGIAAAAGYAALVWLTTVIVAMTWKGFQ